MAKPNPPSPQRKTRAAAAFKQAAAGKTPASSLTRPPQPDIQSTMGMVPVGSTSAASAGVSRSSSIVRYNRWRERYNPLRGLTMARAITLLESYQRGEMADPQWTYFFIEQTDPDLFAILERRESALLELDWNVKLISGRWSKDDPRNEDFDADLATEQAVAVREHYEGIDNLYEAISHLQLATFRGFSHCEKYRNTDGDVYHLEIVDQWNMVRDLLRGRWKYNPAAIQTTFYSLGADMLVDPADFIIRERDRHVNRIALLKAIRNGLADKDWDAFIEIYGLPSGVITGPAGVQSGKEAEYEAAAQEIANGGSGYLPYGSTYTPNDQPRGDSPFKVRLDHLSEKLVLAGTGGLLTMLAQSGSGTLAGNAHMEAFQSIARAEARKISEIFQRQMDSEILDRKFPGQPHLVYFELAANDELDPTEVAKQAAELRTAGYKIDTEQLSERTGYNLTDAPEPATVTEQGNIPGKKPGGTKPQPDPADPATNRAMRMLHELADADPEEFDDKWAVFNREFPSLAAIVNGDLPGHPFHGNQFADAAATAGKTARAATKTAVTSEEHEAAYKLHLDASDKFYAAAKEAHKQGDQDAMKKHLRKSQTHLDQAGRHSSIAIAWSGKEGGRTAAMSVPRPIENMFSPDEPRDPLGKWAGGAGGSGDVREFKVTTTPALRNALGLESDHVYADAAALAKKHPEIFKDGREARDYVDYVFARPTHILPGNETDHRLIVRAGEADDHKAAALEIEKRGGKYRVRSAHTLTDTQFKSRQKKFAGQVVKLGVSRVDPENRETPSRRLSGSHDTPPAIPKILLLTREVK